MLSLAKVYVGILAATILFIATNAGVIGASRITYAMSSHRQLPEVFRRLHPRLKTPWLALIVFGAIGPTIFLLSGQVDFLGRMYAFGAMLSFTIAHLSVIRLRVKAGQSEIEWRARPNLRIRGVSWPLFAIFGAIGTGLAWLVVVEQDAKTRYAGLAWLVAGFVFYVLYRRRLNLPLRETTRTPILLGRPSRSSTGRSSFPSWRGRSRTRRSSSPHGSRASVPAASSCCVWSSCRWSCRSTADLGEQLEDADRLLDELRAYRRGLRRQGGRARRARAERRPGHRRGGGTPRLRDHRPRRPARAGTARSSATPSTMSSSTLRHV